MRFHDWGFLAHTVGYGGSMIWFDASAGVALSIQYNPPGCNGAPA
jgi:hypothetical protein